MKFSHEFEVRRSIERVWSAFQDVPAVAQCLPGAQLKEDRGGGVYAGAVAVKLGPMSAEFEGEAAVFPDPATHRGRVEGQGIDRSGGSRGQIEVDYGLTEVTEGTLVTVDADITLSGAVARFGRSGIVEQMTRRLIGDFVECIEAKLSAETPEDADQIEAPEVRGIRLFLAAVGSRIGRFLRRLFRRG